MSPADAEALEGALRASGADGAALSFVKRMASLNARLDAATAGGAGAGAGDGGDLLDWADKLYGQSVNAVAKGVKSLLSGERRLPLARAVESLMANQPSHETESFAVFDPKAPRGAPAPAPRQGDTPYHDAVVFVVGGGRLSRVPGGARTRAEGPRRGGRRWRRDGRGRLRRRGGGREEERGVRRDGVCHGGGVHRTARRTREEDGALEVASQGSGRSARGEARGEAREATM